MSAIKWSIPMDPTWSARHADRLVKYFRADIETGPSKYYVAKGVRVEEWNPQYRSLRTILLKSDKSGGALLKSYSTAKSCSSIGDQQYLVKVDVLPGHASK